MNIQAVNNAFQPMTPAVEIHKPASVSPNEIQTMVPQIKATLQMEKNENQAESKKNNTGERETTGYSSDDLFTETQLKIATTEDGQVTIKIIDAKTDEVINEIPPEKLAKILSEIRKLSGLIFNQKA